MARQDILVVDGDLRSLRVMEVSLRKAGFLVSTALDGDEALQKIRINRPHLIISDTDLPRLSGFDLLKQVKSNPETAVIPFVFLTGEKSIDHKIRGLELGVEDYLTKPIYIKEIIIRIGILLNRKERERVEQNVTAGFIGSLSDIGIVDVMQTAELNRKTGILTCQGPQGRGMLYFRDGRVVDAEIGRLRGEKAVYRLLLWNEGTFRMSFEEIDRPETIRMNNQALIMEGMRRMDEWIHIMEQLPKPETRLDVDARVLAEKLTEIPDEVDRILRLVDGQRSLIEIVDDSPEDEMKTLDIVSKLYFEGIIYDALKGPSEPKIPLLPEIGAGSLRRSRDAEVAGAAETPISESNWAQSVFAEVAARRGAPEPPADVPVVSGFQPAAGEPPVGEAAPPPAGAAQAVQTQAYGVILQPAPAEPVAADVAAVASSPPGQEPPVASEVLGQAAPAAPETAPSAAVAPEPGSQPGVPQAVPAETATLAPSVPIGGSPEIEIPRAPRTERREAVREDESAAQEVPAAAGGMESEALAEEQFVTALTRHTAPHVKGMMLGKRARRGEIKAEGSRTWIVVVLLVLAGVAAAGAFAFKDRIFGSDLPPSQAAAPARGSAAPATPIEPARPPKAPVEPKAAAPQAVKEPEAPPPKPEVPAAPAAVAEPAVPPVVEPAPSRKAEAAPAPPAPAQKEASYDELVSKGRSLRASGKNAAALRELKKAVAANSKGAEAHSLIGQILIDMDKAADAARHLRAATAADPNDANSFFYLGTAYQISGDAAKARKAYEKYLFLKPTGEFAKDIRTILKDLK
jgi:CheY-like chemotaxis protein